MDDADSIVFVPARLLWQALNLPVESVLGLQLRLLADAALLERRPSCHLVVRKKATSWAYVSRKVSENQNLNARTDRSRRVVHDNL